MSRLFTERLSEGPILADGAMGTELIRRANVAADTCLERLNLTAPELVRQVHLDYLKAGAELIATNTYGWEMFLRWQFNAILAFVVIGAIVGIRVQRNASRIREAEVSSEREGEAAP